MNDEYSHEWHLWDVEHPLMGSIVCARADLADEFTAYNQPKFKLMTSMYMYHNDIGEEVRIWHYRRYPLRDENRG